MKGIGHSTVYTKLPKKSAEFAKQNEVRDLRNKYNCISLASNNGRSGIWREMNSNLAVKY
jgi:hypothetical protein